MIEGNNMEEDLYEDSKESKRTGEIVLKWEMKNQ